MSSLLIFVAISLIFFQFLKLGGMLIYRVMLWVKNPLDPRNQVRGSFDVMRESFEAHHAGQNEESSNQENMS